MVFGIRRKTKEEKILRKVEKARRAEAEKVEVSRLKELKQTEFDKKFKSEREARVKKEAKTKAVFKAKPTSERIGIVLGEIASPKKVPGAIKLKRGRLKSTTTLFKKKTVSPTTRTAPREQLQPQVPRSVFDNNVFGEPVRTRQPTGQLQPVKKRRSVFDAKSVLD